MMQPPPPPEAQQPPADQQQPPAADDQQQQADGGQNPTEPPAVLQERIPAYSGYIAKWRSLGWGNHDWSKYANDGQMDGPELVEIQKLAEAKDTEALGARLAAAKLPSHVPPLVQLLKQAMFAKNQTLIRLKGCPEPFSPLDLCLIEMIVKGGEADQAEMAHLMLLFDTLRIELPECIGVAPGTKVFASTLVDRVLVDNYARITNTQASNLFLLEARCLMKECRDDLAKDTLLRAIELDPTLSDVYLGILDLLTRVPVFEHHGGVSNAADITTLYWVRRWGELPHEKGEDKYDTTAVLRNPLGVEEEPLVGEASGESRGRNLAMVAGLGVAAVVVQAGLWSLARYLRQ